MSDVGSVAAREQREGEHGGQRAGERERESEGGVKGPVVSDRWWVPSERDGGG